MTVGDCAKCATNACSLKKYRQRCDHERCDNGGSNIDLLKRDEAASHFHIDRAARKKKLVGDHDFRLTAEDQLAEPDQEIRQAERRHEQNDIGLIDQWPEDETFNREGQTEHHRDCEGECQERRDAVFVQTHQCECRKHDHDALGKIEYARSLENQHEAERDQGVKNPGYKPLPKRLHEQVGGRAHLHERIDEDLVEQIHKSSVRHAKISVYHGLIAFDFVGCSIGDLDAMIEHNDAVG